MVVDKTLLKAHGTVAKEVCQSQRGPSTSAISGFSLFLGSRLEGILFQEYCFGKENSPSSAANSMSPAKNSVSSLWNIVRRREELTEFSPWNSVRAQNLTQSGISNHPLRNCIRSVSSFQEAREQHFLFASSAQSKTSLQVNKR